MQEQLNLTYRKQNNNYRSKQQLLPGLIAESDIQFLLNYFDYKCAYCGIAIEDNNFHIDHIIPVSLDEFYGTVPFNILTVCPDCNRLKGNLDWVEWIEETFENSAEIIDKIELYRVISGLPDY